MKKIFENILILTDFDGTFAADGTVLVPENLKAVKHFTELGGLFTFSTGRLPSVLSGLFPEYQSYANAPIVMANGAIIIDPNSNKVIKEHFFDGDFGKELSNDVLRKFPELAFVVYTEDGLMQKGKMPDDITNGLWRKARFNGPDETVSSAREYIGNKYGNEISCFRSWYSLVEIISKNADKGKAVRFLKEYYKKQGRDIKVLCIGDFENDVSMLKEADISFCPSNAIDEVKAVSKYQTVSNNEGAVADMIEKIKTIFNLTEE